MWIYQKLEIKNVLLAGFHVLPKTIFDFLLYFLLKKCRIFSEKTTTNIEIIALPYYHKRFIANLSNQSPGES